MGYTDLRGTAPMDRITGEPGRRIGVVSLSPGAGASFICSLLKRELLSSRESLEIIDLGEEKGGSPDMILMVADCSQAPEKNFPEMMKFIKRKGLRFGIVLNKYNNEGENSELMRIISEAGQKTPIFRIPVLDTAKFTELYNFVFYS